MEKQKYQTKQGSQLLAYLEQRQGIHITANDICQDFKEQGKSIGVATIYRHLERFAEEGLLIKYHIDGNSPACFEYHGKEETEPHIHCKCEKCGVLIHLVCTHFQEMESHLSEHHAFFINQKKTVLYGLCPDCYQS